MAKKNGSWIRLGLTIGVALTAGRFLAKKQLLHYLMPIMLTTKFLLRKYEKQINRLATKIWSGIKDTTVRLTGLFRQPVFLS